MAFGDGPADEELEDAWHRFCDRLKAAGRQAFKDANPAHPVLRADAFRFLTQNLGQAFDLALETKDPRYPQLHPFCTPTRKLGGDVADFTYRQAWIDGSHVYRITGRRGTARWLNVTVQGPRPETIPARTGRACTSPSATSRGQRVRPPAPDRRGRELRALRRRRRTRPHNWLPTTPGSRKLFVREAFDAWGETPTTLSHRTHRHGRPAADPGAQSG